MKEIEKDTKNPDEIDLIEVFKKIWDGRKIIYRTVAVFFVLGLIVAFGSQKEYKSEVKLLVMEKGTSGVSGMLAQFGGLAGLNFGASANSDEMLSPDLYPDIIESTPFLLNILNQKIHIKKLDTIATVYDFLSKLNPPSGLDVIKKYSIGLPFTIIGWFKTKNKEIENLPDSIKNLNQPLILTKEQEDIANAIKGSIKVTKGETAGVVSISVELPDSKASSELCAIVVKLLTQYTINYRIQKAKADLDFIAEQHKQAEIRYEAAQQKLADYQDANRGIALASARSEGERLQNEYNLAFNVYNGLSQQYEQAKIKVQETTPVIKVIEPAREPLNKSKPKRAIIMVAMIFIGGIIGVGIIFGKLLKKNYLGN